MESARPEFRLLPIREVVKLVGVSRPQIYKLMKQGFPKPVHVSARARAWRNDEVLDWIEARSAEREAA